MQSDFIGSARFISAVVAVGAMGACSSSETTGIVPGTGDGGGPGEVSDGGGVPGVPTCKGKTIASIEFGTPISVPGISPAASSTTFHRQSIHVVDINKDGRPDILVDEPTSTAVLLNNGKGSFTVTHLALTCGTSGAFADFDGDGNIDALCGFGTLAQRTDNHSFCKGHGDGTFSCAPIAALPVVTTCLAGGGTGECALVVRAVDDFNGDGMADAILEIEAPALPNTVRYQLLVGDRSGVFPLVGLPAFPDVDMYSTANAVLTTDLNLDGKRDVFGWIAASKTSAQTLQILLGKGDNTFSTSPLPNGIAGSAAYAGDMDGDGHPDVLTIASTGGAATIYKSRKGAPEVSTTTLAALAATGTFVIDTGDVNCDGLSDIGFAFSANSANDFRNQIGVLVNKGDGTFTSYASFVAGSFASTFRLADVDGDGIADVITASSDSGGKTHLDIYIAKPK